MVHHIGKPLEVHHRKAVLEEVQHTDSPARGISMEVHRAQQGFLLVQHLVDLPAAQTVVAAGDDIRTAVVDLADTGGQHAVALSGIFTVDHHHIGSILLFQGTEPLFQQLAAIGAYHIAQKQNSHKITFFSIKWADSVLVRTPARRTASRKSSGGGAMTSIRSPVTGCGNQIRSQCRACRSMRSKSQP